MNSTISKILFLILIVINPELNMAQELKSGEKAPPFIMETLNSDEFNLEKVESKYILLDFWAGWCKPCVKTIESTLIPLSQKYNKSQLEIVSISYDKTIEKWEKAVEKLNMDWIHVYDQDSELYKKYHIEYIPTYYIINDEGEIIASKILSSELTNYIDSLLNK